MDIVSTHGGIAISWRSTKQSSTTTSSNHAKLIALYKTIKEWLRLVICHIQKGCGVDTMTNSPTIIYEDNTDCVDQVS